MYLLKCRLSNPLSFNFNFCEIKQNILEFKIACPPSYAAGVNVIKLLSEHAEKVVCLSSSKIRLSHAHEGQIWVSKFLNFYAPYPNCCKVEFWIRLEFLLKSWNFRRLKLKMYISLRNLFTDNKNEWRIYLDMGHLLSLFCVV